MRSHQQIIADAGGYKKLAVAIGLAPERARFWERRGSIPPEHWLDLANKRIATLKELATAAAARRDVQQDAA